MLKKVCLAIYFYLFSGYTSVLVVSIMSNTAVYRKHSIKYTGTQIHAYMFFFFAQVIVK